MNGKHSRAVYTRFRGHSRARAAGAFWRAFKGWHPERAHTFELRVCCTRQPPDRSFVMQERTGEEFPLSLFISRAVPYPSCKRRRELASSPCHRLRALPPLRRSRVRECTTRFQRFPLIKEARPSQFGTSVLSHAGGLPRYF